jgi:hypothetical protein
MIPEAAGMVPPLSPAADLERASATLQALDERTRAIAEVAEGLRPLIALAQQAPAFAAIALDAFDEMMRMAGDKGIDVERGLLNGAEAALRFGATMDAAKVREIDALLNSSVLAPTTLQIIGELGRALTETAATRPSRLGVLGLFKALGQPEVQRALKFLVTFAERFGRRLRELPAVHG